jgi:hypothetical protein
MDHEKLRVDLEYITQTRELCDGDSLRSVLARLDAAASEHGLPDRLQHYLIKRSYTKALNWLDNPNAPHHP